MTEETLSKNKEKIILFFLTIFCLLAFIGFCFLATGGMEKVSFLSGHVEKVKKQNEEGYRFLKEESEIYQSNGHLLVRHPSSSFIKHYNFCPCKIDGVEITHDN